LAIAVTLSQSGIIIYTMRKEGSPGAICTWTSTGTASIPENAKEGMRAMLIGGGMAAKLRQAGAGKNDGSRLFPARSRLLSASELTPGDAIRRLA
jgi:hypothetical protein